MSELTVEEKETLQYDEDSRAYNAERARRIAASPMSYQDKIIQLSKNKPLHYDLVDLLLSYGLNLKNLFQGIDPKTFGNDMPDENGNTYRDFLESDNNQAFMELEKIVSVPSKAVRNPALLKELKLDKEFRKLYDRTELALYIRKVQFDLLEEIPDSFDSDFRSNRVIKKIKKLIADIVKRGLELQLFDRSYANSYVNGMYDLLKQLAYDTLDAFDFDDDRKEYDEYVDKYR